MKAISKMVSKLWVGEGEVEPINHDLVRIDAEIIFEGKQLYMIGAKDQEGNYFEFSLPKLCVNVSPTGGLLVYDHVKKNLGIQ